MDYFSLYIIALIIPMLFVYPKIILGYKTKNFILYLIAASFLLVLNSLLYKFSGDYIPYILYLESIRNELSFSNQLLQYNYEIGFSFFCWLLKSLLGDANSVYLFLIFIPSIILLSSFYLKSKIPLLSLVIYIAHFHWWIGLVLIRQLCASIFVLIAIDYLLNKRSLLFYCIFIICATLFHNSAVVFLMLPIYLYFDFNIKYQITLIAFSFIIGQTNLINSFVGLIFDNISRGSVYTTYIGTERGLNYLAYVEKIMVFIFMFKCRVTNNVAYKNNLLFYSFALIVCGLLFKTEVASRLLSYFDIYIYVYIIPSILLFLNKKNRILFTIIVFPYLLFYLYRFISITIIF